MGTCETCKWWGGWVSGRVYTPDRAPTHRCTVCGAFWVEWKDSWSLCSKQCGQCCDNVAMGDQIVPLIVSDIYAPADENTRLTEALRAADEREKALREALERAEIMVEFTQEDKEAALKVWPTPGWVETYEAFARHRTAAEQRGKLEGARLAIEAAHESVAEVVNKGTADYCFGALSPTKIVGEG